MNTSGRHLGSDIDFLMPHDRLITLETPYEEYRSTGTFKYAYVCAVVFFATPTNQGNSQQSLAW